MGISEQHVQLMVICGKEAQSTANISSGISSTGTWLYSIITMTGSHTTEYIHQCDNPLVSAYTNATIPGEAMHTTRWCMKAQFKL